MALYRFSERAGCRSSFTNTLRCLPFGAKRPSHDAQRMGRFGVNEEARQFLPSGARTFRVVVMLEGAGFSVPG